MISVNAATLLATILPIGILIIAVEARALPATSPRYRWSGKVATVLRVLQLLIIINAMSVVVTCITTVVNNTSLKGGHATYVLVSSYALYLVVVIVVIGLVFERLGFLDSFQTLGDKIEARAKARKASTSNPSPTP